MVRSESADVVSVAIRQIYIKIQVSNEALNMTERYEPHHIYDWSSGKYEVNYHKFLQDREHIKSIEFAVDNQTRKLIGNNEQLMQRGIGIIQEELSDGFSLINESLVEGFAGVREDLQSIDNSIKQLDITVERGFTRVSNDLRWGFNSLLESDKKTQDLLEELIAVSKNPSFTWAYEQYALAISEYKRELFRESLTSIKRAINGFHTNVGIGTEFRFHLLKGQILLGNSKNHCKDVVDLEAAEDAYLYAVKCATDDYFIEKAEAFLSAGRAAFCRAAFSNAERHLKNAIELVPNFSDAHYLLSRVYSNLGKDEFAYRSLAFALSLNPDFAIRAAGEAEFQLKSDLLLGTTKEAIVTLEKIYANCENKFDAAMSELNQLVGNHPKCQALMQDTALVLEEIKKSAQTKKGTGTLFGVQMGIMMYSSVNRQLVVTKSKFEDALLKFCDIRTLELDNDIKLTVENSILNMPSRPQKSDVSGIAGLFYGIAAVFFVVGIFLPNAIYFISLLIGLGLTFANSAGFETACKKYDEEVAKKLNERSLTIQPLEDEKLQLESSKDKSKSYLRFTHIPSLSDLSFKIGDLAQKDSSSELLAVLIDKVGQNENDLAESIGKLRPEVPHNKILDSLSYKLPLFVKDKLTRREAWMAKLNLERAGASAYIQEW